MNYTKKVVKSSNYHYKSVGPTVCKFGINSSALLKKVQGLIEPTMKTRQPIKQSHLPRIFYSAPFKQIRQLSLLAYLN